MLRLVHRPHAVLALLTVGIAAVAWAQTPTVEHIRADFEERSEQLDEMVRWLESDRVSDERLDEDLETLLALSDETKRDAETIDRALKEPQQRLNALGPPPEKGQPAESATIANLRSELSTEVSQLTGLAKNAELIEATIGELIDRIQSMKRSRELSELRARVASPLSPSFWTRASQEIEPSWNRLRDGYAKRWRAEKQEHAWGADVALLLLALGGAIALMFLPRSARWRNLEAELDDNPKPSALDKRRRVAARSMSRALVVATAGALLFGAGLETGLITPIDQKLALRIWLGAVSLALVYQRATCVFSPAEPTWRLAPCTSRGAGPLRSLLVAILVVFVIDRTLEAGFVLADAAPELSLALRVIVTTLFAVLLWFFLSPPLWEGDDQTPPEEAPPSSTDASDELPKSKVPWWHRVLRRGGRPFALLLLVSLALGYVLFPSFLSQRIVLLFLFFVLFQSLRRLALWAVSKVPAPSPVKSEDGGTEESDSEQESLGFWLRVAVELNLLVLALPGFMLVFGFDWLDVRRVFDWFSADIRIGAVSVSFTNVLLAVIVFFLFSAGTRWVTSVVDRKLLKSAPIEAGARSSMTTLIDYAGLLVALLIALPIAGIGFSKIAIIAGALSVGIGFGLQNIVNNFVSGLILLFERPVKPGDWVVLPSGQGYVKQIGARATEIQTFDKAAILVPNSELVSTAVQNWFHRNRTGRIRVEIGVAYGSDPEQVRDILVQCAKDHESIMPYPVPEAVWLDFGDSSLNFELRAYLRNYDNALHIRSDLRFAIFAAFKKAGITIPFPQRDLHIYTEPVAESEPPPEAPQDR